TLPGDGDGAGGEIEIGDGGLVADVDALLGVLLLGGEEQRLEARDLLPVDVRDATRAVRGVFELGEDDDLAGGDPHLAPPVRAAAGRRLWGARGGSGAGGPAAEVSVTGCQAALPPRRPWGRKGGWSVVHYRRHRRPFPMRDVHGQRQRIAVDDDPADGHVAAF